MVHGIEEPGRLPPAQAIGIERSYHTQTISGSNAQDEMTVLTTFGPPATKVIGKRDGHLRISSSYGKAAFFSCRQWPFSGLDDLFRNLVTLARRPRSLVIRGALLPNADPERCRRLRHAKREDDGTLSPPCFESRARRYCALDIDGFAVDAGWFDDLDGTVQRIVETLPEDFKDVGTVCQATSSALLKPGARVRLWYVLDKPLADEDCRRWLASSSVDLSLFRAVQPHYTASPIFRGCSDPIAKRVVLLKRRRNVVQVSDLPEVEPEITPAMMRHPTFGSAYAERALQDECGIVSNTPAGRRHEALNRAAFNLARFIATGNLEASQVVNGLIWAARYAGIDDSDDELRRFLRCGLHAGYERAI